jgi:hypothetical protein
VAHWLFGPDTHTVSFVITTPVRLLEEKLTQVGVSVLEVIVAHFACPSRKSAQTNPV